MLLGANRCLVTAPAVAKASNCLDPGSLVAHFATERLDDGIDDVTASGGMESPYVVEDLITSRGCSIEPFEILDELELERRQRDSLVVQIQGAL